MRFLFPKTKLSSRRIPPDPIAGIYVHRAVLSKANRSAIVRFIPVELVDLTLSLGSFGNQYQRFFEWKTRKSKMAEEDRTDAEKLFITKIESNCIITELAAYAQSNLPAVYLPLALLAHIAF